MCLHCPFLGLEESTSETTPWNEPAGEEEEFDDEARPHAEDVCEESEPGPEGWPAADDELRYQVSPGGF